MRERVLGYLIEQTARGGVRVGCYSIQNPLLAGVLGRQLSYQTLRLALQLSDVHRCRLVQLQQRNRGLTSQVRLYICRQRHTKTPCL